MFLRSKFLRNTICTNIKLSSSLNLMNHGELRTWADAGIFGRKLQSMWEPSALAENFDLQKGNEERWAGGYKQCHSVLLFIFLKFTWPEIHKSKCPQAKLIKLENCLKSKWQKYPKGKIRFWTTWSFQK